MSFHNPSLKNELNPPPRTSRIQCFYTGSLEGTDGAANGKLLHQLADRRCQNFKTCGVEGTELAGMAKLNYDIFNLIAVGQFQLQTGNCPAARLTTDKIISKMYIPIIQGTLRYAFAVAELLGGEKEQAEGAAFAAAVLPRIHAACESHADTSRTRRFHPRQLAVPHRRFLRISPSRLSYRTHTLQRRAPRRSYTTT